MSSNPMRKTGQTKVLILNEKPADIIQAVSVVPILAPMTSGMAIPTLMEPVRERACSTPMEAAED